MTGRSWIYGAAAAILMLATGTARAQTQIIVGTSNSMPGCMGLFNSTTREPVFVDGRRLAVNEKCGPAALRAHLKSGKVTIPALKKTCSEAQVLNGSC